jgi:hypothetical protein
MRSIHQNARRHPGYRIPRRPGCRKDKHRNAADAGSDARAVTHEPGNRQSRKRKKSDLRVMDGEPRMYVKVQELMRLWMKYFDHRQKQGCAYNQQPVEETVFPARMHISLLSANGRRHGPL